MSTKLFSSSQSPQKLGKVALKLEAFALKANSIEGLASDIPSLQVERS
ncbi:MAG TPA: hypothetical protein IGR89_15185 [Oscillatoriaceae cyanobacterium M7585_C2015_266]|nr:hypothetical protein [Oscillatoriaceae cyanobacterium M7585_C2015_266]